MGYYGMAGRMPLCVPRPTSRARTPNASHYWRYWRPAEARGAGCDPAPNAPRPLTTPNAGPRDGADNEHGENLKLKRQPTAALVIRLGKSAVPL